MHATNIIATQPAYSIAFLVRLEQGNTFAREMLNNNNNNN